MIENIINFMSKNRNILSDIIFYIITALFGIFGNAIYTDFLRNNMKKWSNSKLTTYTIVLIISWISATIMIFTKLSRRYNSIYELLKFSDKSKYYIIVPFIIMLLSFVIMTIIDKSSEDEPDDSSTTETTETTSTPTTTPVSKTNGWVIFLVIVFGILVFSGIIGLMYFFRNDMRIMIPILIITLILVILIVIISATKPESKVPFDAKLDLKYDDPTDRTYTSEKLKNILQQLGEFKMDNECKIDGQNDCSYLYQEFIKSDGNPETLNHMLEQLNKMDKSKSGLINQAVFLIYQLLQCKLSAKDTYTRFGTMDWWRKNILMYGGNDPIQNYIYAISILICMLFLVYNLGTYIKHSPNIFVGHSNWTVYGIGMTFVYTVSLLISYFSFSSGGEYSKTKSSTELTEGSKWGWGMLGTNLGLLFVSIIASFFGSNMGKVNAIAILLSFIISFNAYYMTIIPQLMVIGIILQKYILQTEMPDDIMAMIVKGIMVIVVLFASFFDTTYANKDTEDTKNVTPTYNKPIWYIFGILVFLLIQNGVESMTGLTKNYGDTQWSLVLMPAMRYIIEVIGKKSIPNSMMSINN